MKSFKQFNEVAPPGFGHTKSDKDKGVKKGGTAAAFDRARKRGDFKGSKSDMFAIMWSQKNKGDKPHYKPGTDEKYKKYQEDWKPEIEVIDTKKRKKDAEKKRKEAASSLPPHLRLDAMKKAFAHTNEQTTMKDNNLFGNAYAGSYEDLKKKVGSKKKHDKPAIKENKFVDAMVSAVRKKKEERKPEKAMDAGARAKRKLARKVHRSTVSDFVPKELEDHKTWSDFRKHI